MKSFILILLFLIIGNSNAQEVYRGFNTVVYTVYDEDSSKHKAIDIIDIYGRITFTLLRDSANINIKYFERKDSLALGIWEINIKEKDYIVVSLFEYDDKDVYYNHDRSNKFIFYYEDYSVWFLYDYDILKNIYKRGIWFLEF